MEGIAFARDIGSSKIAAIVGEITGGELQIIGFGSTEAGSISRFHIDHDTEIPGTAIPIGYAVQDKEILLLDDAGQGVGFDSIGEIKASSTALWARNDKQVREAMTVNTKEHWVSVYLVRGEGGENSSRYIDFRPGEPVPTFKGS